MLFSEGMDSAESVDAEFDGKGAPSEVNSFSAAFSSTRSAGDRGRVGRGTIFTRERIFMGLPAHFEGDPKPGNVQAWTDLKVGLSRTVAFVGPGHQQKPEPAIGCSNDGQQARALQQVTALQ